MSKNKELAEVKNTDVALASNLVDWGDSPISANDIIIPRLLLMQGQSDLVIDGKAVTGDIVDNSTQTVVAKPGEPMELIPFHVEKLWIVSRKKKGASRFEFEKFIPVTLQNEKMEWNMKEGDEEIKNEYSFQVYFLNPKDPSIPFIATFKSTSLRTGKALMTQMYVRNAAAGLVPAAYVVELSSHKEKNDQGNFAVWDCKPSRKSTAEELTAALTWLKTVRSGKTRVSEEADLSAASEVAGQGSF